jgi:hypothetical protein
MRTTRVHQIRKSCAARNLLQLKRLISNHPLTRGQVDFEEAEKEGKLCEIVDQIWVKGGLKSMVYSSERRTKTNKQFNWFTIMNARPHRETPRTDESILTES